MKLIKGFEVFPALYDPKTNEVLTIHCMLPADFFYEFFDKKRTKDVIAYIKQWATSQIWFDL